MSTLSNAIYNIFANMEDDDESVISTDEVIKTIGHSSELNGGKRVDDMVADNVMSGGDASNDIFTQIYEDAAKNDTNIFDEIYEHRDEIIGGDNSSSSSSSSDEEDSSDAVEGDDNDDSDDTNEHVERYLRIINELREPTAIKGGSVKPVRRIRIVNAFPYLIKVAPEHM